MKVCTKQQICNLVYLRSDLQVISSCCCQTWQSTLLSLDHTHQNWHIHSAMSIYIKLCNACLLYLIVCSLIYITLLFLLMLLAIAANFFTVGLIKDYLSYRWWLFFLSKLKVGIRCIFKFVFLFTYVLVCLLYRDKYLTIKPSASS